MRPWMLILSFWMMLSACQSAPAGASPCDHRGFQIVPTATRPSDPDLFSPPMPPATETAPNGCPTPLPTSSPVANALDGFVAAEVVNLSLDMADQDLAATAVGDDMIAAAWMTGGEIFVALSRGGNHFQVRRLDSGGSISLAFSSANRLHVVYEQNGRILYRAADQGTHPADAASIYVADGRTPQVVMDELNWAHVIYEQNGSLYKAKHLANDRWLIQFIAYGTTPTARPFYNEKELVLWGVPTGTSWFGILLAAPYNGQIRLFRYLSWFNVWEQVAAFPIPAGETLTGSIGLDFLTAGDTEAWVYASWVIKRPNPAPPASHYAQPVFTPVNPLFPDQIANPHFIYAGLNAARWGSDADPFDAGLRQTISVPNPNGTITAAAWGRTDSAVTLQLGIDPTGGQNAASPAVVWSLSSSPSAFTRFDVTVPAQGSAATIFLRGTLNSPRTAGTAVWDAVMVQNGTVTNGSFEGSFVTQGSLLVPDGWTAWYRDSGNMLPDGRDVFTIYAAWSANGGAAWAGPAAVVANRDLSGGTTGAIRSDVTPIITLATNPPTVNFFYVYETGDPPPGSSFLRFGRPVLTQCALGSANCTEPPGQPLLPRQVVRPTYRLLATADPFNPDRTFLLWDALQADAANKDVYVTYATLR